LLEAYTRQNPFIPAPRLLLLSSDRGEVESTVRCGGGMNKTYQVVLSDDERKRLPVVLKKEKM